VINYIGPQIFGVEMLSQIIVFNFVLEMESFAKTTYLGSSLTVLTQTLIQLVQVCFSACQYRCIEALSFAGYMEW